MRYALSALLMLALLAPLSAFGQFGESLTVTIRGPDGKIVQTVQITGLDGQPFLQPAPQTPTVATPELAILYSFGLGPHVAAVLNPTLQRVTAWGATRVLRTIQIPAVQRGVYVQLPSVRLEVEPWCSGLASMKWLVLLALFLVIVGHQRLPWKVALVILAPLIALEANMLRVAGVGMGIELFGHDARHIVKEWLGWGAIGVGVVQVVGLGRWMNRRTV